MAKMICIDAKPDENFTHPNVQPYVAMLREGQEYDCVPYYLVSAKAPLVTAGIVGNFGYVAFLKRRFAPAKRIESFYKLLHPTQREQSTLMRRDFLLDHDVARYVPKREPETVR